MAESSRNRYVIVVGASAGGVEALRMLVANVPSDLSAAILVVLHLPSGGISALAPILDRHGPLPATVATDGGALRQGTITVAPPDFHLLIDRGQTRLTTGPAENGHRPAINALFRSAAVAGADRVVGVLLSGALDDGVSGLANIAERGGKAVVQDPEDALYPAMPTNAMNRVEVDHVLPAAEIGGLLGKLATEEVVPVTKEGDRLLELENRIALDSSVSARAAESGALGPPSGYSCPDCSGSLMEIGNGRYRCRVGHAWTADALLDAQNKELERALWTALRTLDEKSSLSRRLAANVASGASSRLVERYQHVERETNRAAEVLRAHLLNLYAEKPDAET